MTKKVIFQKASFENNKTSLGANIICQLEEINLLEKQIVSATEILLFLIKVVSLDKLVFSKNKNYSRAIKNK